MQAVSMLALWLVASAVVDARPQASSSPSITASSSGPVSFDLANATTITDFTASVPTGSYQTYSDQMTVTDSSSSSQQGNATRSSNATVAVGSSYSTILSGTNGATTSLSNSTRTSTAATPSNTQRCNGYREFCNRQYLNVTEVCAHNSAFAIKNNVASNQLYDITSQLDDGVRMIQGETHWYNGTIYSCHTSCSLLNAGTLQNELETVAAWVRRHPYDVVTILLVNSDFRDVTDYVDPIQNSGLAPYLYEPPKIPMHRADWPTYGEMIVSSKRVVIFMDYDANQTAVPYILDEFSQMWETPFSPTNASFPCTQQRPPGLSTQDAETMPYLANHNLNLELSFGGTDLLVPAYTNLTTENAVSGYSSAGEMMDTCVSMWSYAPSFLLVDYYNFGDWPGSGRSSNNSGSVFEVAARLNGVNYESHCCGPTDGNAAAANRAKSGLVAVVAAVLGLFMVM